MTKADITTRILIDIIKPTGLDVDIFVDEVNITTITVKDCRENLFIILNAAGDIVYISTVDKRGEWIPRHKDMATMDVVREWASDREVNNVTSR